MLVIVYNEIDGTRYHQKKQDDGVAINYLRRHFLEIVVVAYGLSKENATRFQKVLLFSSSTVGCGIEEKSKIN